MCAITLCSTFPDATQPTFVDAYGAWVKEFGKTIGRKGVPSTDVLGSPRRQKLSIAKIVEMDAANSAAFFQINKQCQN